MDIQTSRLFSSLAYSVKTSSPRQTVAGPTGTAGVGSTDTVTISQEAKDRFLSDQTGPSAADRTMRYREMTLWNARNDAAFAEKMALDYAYDTSYETSGPLVDIGSHPGAPQYYSNTGELLTDSNLAEFKNLAAKATAGRIALYQTEKTKGTPDADILDKLYGFTDTQPASYLSKAGWGTGNLPQTTAATLAPSSQTNRASYDTGQGVQNLDIDAYFTPNESPSSLSTLPPLLLPSPGNIKALTAHISERLPQFLSQNNIPAAPSSIDYGDDGQLQLPADYPYASQFKQALANHPTMERELRTVHALASTLAEMQKSIPFQQEYAAASTPDEAAAVVQKYSGLFSPNRRYTEVALLFSKSGDLSLSADGKPYWGQQKTR
jgi:hypothetical protein